VAQKQVVAEEQRHRIAVHSRPAKESLSRWVFTTLSLGWGLAAAGAAQAKSGRLSAIWEKCLDDHVIAALWRYGI
jgi:hypothetical protein